MSDFDIKQLSDRAGVTPRTVHFYVQQGLLPPASAPGPGARYGEGHVARLRLIRLLQKQHQPLAEIAKRLKVLSDSQVGDLVAEAAERRAAKRESALDYIRDVLGKDQVSGSESAAALGAREIPVEHHAAPLASPPPAPAVGTARSQWERFSIADGVELHVQRPLPRLEQRKLDRLLAAAREIFRDE